MKIDLHPFLLVLLCLRRSHPRNLTAGSAPCLRLLFLALAGAWLGEARSLEESRRPCAEGKTVQ
jgi:hypothetical protein